MLVDLLLSGLSCPLTRTDPGRRPPLRRLRSGPLIVSCEGRRHDKSATALTGGMRRDRVVAHVLPRLPGKAEVFSADFPSPQDRPFSHDASCSCPSRRPSGWDQARGEGCLPPPSPRTFFDGDVGVAWRHVTVLFEASSCGPSIGGNEDVATASRVCRSRA
jgi:hypothetical protein